MEFWNTSTQNVIVILQNAFGESNLPMYSLIYCIILLVMSAVTAVANGFVIALILKDPLKNLRNWPSNYLVLCLAFIDFTVGAVQELLDGIWHVYFFIYGVYPFPASIIFTFRAMMLTASMTALLALGSDRMIAVRSPLLYKSKVTLKKVKIVILGVWLHGLLHGIIYGNLFYRYFFTINMIFLGHVLFSFVVLFVNYTVLICSFRNQSSQVREMSKSQRSSKGALRRQKNVTSAILVILTAFKICFLPWVLSFLLLSTCRVCSLRTLVKAFSFGTSLMYFNSLINPFLYAYRLPKYKQAFKYLFKGRGNIRKTVSEKAISTSSRRGNVRVLCKRNNSMNSTSSKLKMLVSTTKENQQQEAMELS